MTLCGIIAVDLGICNGDLQRTRSPQSNVFKILKLRLSFLTIH